MKLYGYQQKILKKKINSFIRYFADPRVLGILALPSKASHNSNVANRWQCNLLYLIMFEYIDQF